MESQYHLDTDYFDEDTETTYSTQKSFDLLGDEIDALRHGHGKEPTMQWQSHTNIFHFTLVDDEFKNAIHTTFTPHSTRNLRQMTFDPDKPYGSSGGASAVVPEDEETGPSTTPVSRLMPIVSQSMNDLKCDQSVTAIGSDGKVVLSDMGRFKSAQSVPLTEDGENVLSEDEEYEYEVKYDDDPLVQKTNPPKKMKKLEAKRKAAGKLQRMRSHHRTETLHGRLLDAVPHADRKNLQITIHSDFSAEVVEKGRHYKAETAILNFTLKPVHSMKILM